MSVAVLPPPPTLRSAEPPLRLLDPMPRAQGRRVTILAVHHVRVDGRTLTGGAEKYIRTVIRALLDAGVEVHVGYSGTTIYEDLLEQYDPRRLTVERTGWLNEALSGDRSISLNLLRQRRRWLRATGADTVFAVQQAAGTAFGVSLLAAKSLSLRVVASLRQEPPALPVPCNRRRLGLVPRPHFWAKRLIWQRRWPALCCDRLIYNSHRVAVAYQEHYGYPKRKARVIFNGEMQHPRHAANRSGFPRRIAAVGRVTEAKGADLLFDAFTVVARRFPASSLTYYGDGPLVSVLADRARSHGLADRVTFAGYRPDREGLFDTVDLCVQMSRRESMSNSVVESLARAIPCVVADVGGMPETVVDGQSGYVVPTGDATACADAISKLMGNPRRYARFARAACLRARRCFDIRPLMRQTVETILGIDEEA